MSEKENDSVVTQETPVETSAETQEAPSEISSSSIFNRRRGLLTEFEADVLDPNTVGSTSIPLSTTPTVIACLTDNNVLSIDDVCDRVWLTCTVGWEAIANAPGMDRVNVLFKILRGGTRHQHCNGEVIFSCCQSANAGDCQTTTFCHVDLPLANNPLNKCEDDGNCHTVPKVPYIVTAELPLGGEATVTGPITFCGAEIEQNPPF